jgi:quercetin dioxygenase-like cupin family protein
MSIERSLQRLAELESIAVWEGVRARRVVGERSMLAVVELEPNTMVPEHRHPHEQLGIVLYGSGSFRVGDKTRAVEPGSTWRIPGDVPHEFHVGPEGAVVIDVFAPAREDWDDLPVADARQPLWPERTATD